MKELRLLCFLFLCIPCFGLNAQELSFHAITTEDGLPSSEVYFSFRDHNGYMWFSTDNGVCRYNGFQFKKFTIDDGLVDNTTFHITEDNKGRLWCDGLNGGLCYIINDKVHAIPGSDSLRKLLQGAKGLIRKIYADRNNTIWVATTMGFFWLNEKENYSLVHAFSDMPAEADKLSFVSNDSVAFFSGNYIENRNQIRSQKQKELIILFDIFGKRKMIPCPISSSSVVESPCGVVTAEGDLVFNFYNTIFRLGKNGLDSLTTVPQSPICMFYNSDHSFWIGTMANGVYCYRNNDFSKPVGHYLDGISVSGVCTDFEGGIWFSTLEKGVMYCPEPTVIDYSGIPFLSHRFTTIGIIKSGLIFGTNSGAISTLNNETDSITALRLFKAPITLNDIWQDSAWIYLAGSRTASRINNHFGEIQSYGVESEIGKSDSLPGSGSYDVIVTKTGKRYFISDKFLFELRDTIVTLPGGKSKLYRVQHNVLSLPSRGRLLYYSRRSEILIGCLTGMYEFDEQLGLIRVGGKDSLLMSRTSDIAEDKYGRLWMSTINNGVLAWDRKNVIQFSIEHGLPKGNCMGLEFDEQGNLWVATPNGLAKFTVNYGDVRKTHIDAFDVSSGLISNEITRLCVYKGKVWVGTIKGLCTVDIATMKANTFAPPVYISAIQVDDSLYSRYDTFPVLQYDQNNFRFYLEALSYRGKKTLTYLYKLVGYDEKWLETSDPVLVYQNLPAGDYKLIVIAKNNFGFKSSSPAEFSFTIPAPFWETWWFRSLILLFIGGLIYVFIRYRLNQIRLREKEKTYTQKLVSEFQLTALRSQMNPHFIFNAINSIQSFILQNNAEEAYDYLAKFSKLIRSVLNHSQQRVILLEQEIDMLKLYLQLEELRFTKMFKYRFEIDDGIDESQISIPSMLIQPYVENAIWHGLMNLHGEREAQLLIRIKVAGDLLKIIVEDNGVGREAARKMARDFTHKSLAMELSRQRLELMNQMPEEEKSSVVITDLYDENRNARGTAVEIIVRYNSISG